ncbi:MAG: heavy metal translocating P-type ATPase [Eubacteriales bacterium]|nr:heavy metal translocating P-type ATPase [Eubacteriales bacterium]
MNKKQKKVLYKIIITIVLLAVISFIPAKGTLKFILYMIPYLIIGCDVLKKAVHGVKCLQPFDENFLMAVATVGAIALGEYTEGVAVMLFYQIGELFQSYAVGKSRRNISELMDIRPDTAYIENADGEIEEVDPDEVEIGTVIVVRPGEKIPIDGIVVEGNSSLNTSALTGESVPRAIREGNQASSGCINMTGTLKIQTTREFGESTASKILDLVENASSRKSRSEAFISKFARVYTPAVCFAALMLAVAAPLVSMLLGFDAGWGKWVYRALTFLVISCPCALVISIPLTFFAGIGGASNAGVLVKGSVYLEALSEVKTVVFDKTGTLTEGVFEVTDIIVADSAANAAGVSAAGAAEADSAGMSKERLIELAAFAENYSTHPVSQSLREAYGRSIDANRVSEVQEISGHGVTAKVDGISVAAGNARLMKRLGISFEETGCAGTLVYVAADGKYLGSICISDKLKSTSAQAISALKKAGMKTVMLTGDVKSAGEAAAGELGIDEVFTGLLPGDKVDRLEEIINSSAAKAKTAFVGDGINDAPVLSRADVGIAMGALGSDAAIEAADVVLMDDDPLKIVKAVKIASKCMRIVYENIYFAIGVKLLCLLLGAVGIANMWAAIFADVGVMVIAVLNAIRALSVKKL